MASQRFDFRNGNGRRLTGRLELPQATSRGWAIFAHCFTCGKDSLAAVRVSRALARSGIGVLRFDFAGLGGSDGEFGSGSFAADIGDLIAAASAMAGEGMPPSLVVGHSLGGAAVLAAAGAIGTVSAVATIAAPEDAAAALALVPVETLATIDREGAADVELGGRPFHITRSLVDGLRSHDLKEDIRSLNRPLLVMHAPGDRTVGIENATGIFQTAHHPKSFVSLNQADHLLTRTADAEYAVVVIAAWATRYLPGLEADVPQNSDAGGVSAVETLGGEFQVRLRSGRHYQLADEPISVGGLGTGPSPFEILSWALAACTVMTIRIYARRKAWPLDRVEARVHHRKRKGEHPEDVFERVVTLEGDLDPEQRTRILAIADRCPVDLTLVRGSEVMTRLE